MFIEPNPTAIRPPSGGTEGGLARRCVYKHCPPDGGRIGSAASINMALLTEGGWRSGSASINMALLTEGGLARRWRL